MRTTVFIPDHWKEVVKETTDKIIEELEIRSQNDIQLPTQEIQKRGYFVNLDDDVRYHIQAFGMEEYRHDTLND